MKRIGILTYFTDFPYFNDLNPGMNLQAYSVFRTLSAQYPDAKVEFIRYHSWWAEWRPYVSGLTFKSILQDFRQLYKYYKFSRVFPRSKGGLVSRDRIRALEYIKHLEYDAVYVGSDTLLELFRFGEDEISAYWLSSLVPAKKFMLAASARDTSILGLSDIQKGLLRESIESFDGLGVRDTATFDLIAGLSGGGDERLKIIPDPTFALEIDYSFVEKYFVNKGFHKLNKPIACFHLLKNSEFAVELAGLYRKKGYLIASFRPAEYADILLRDLSPMEFAGVFRYFDIMLTHRFHDSIFCIKNQCPVLLYPPSINYENEKGDSKQLSLMKLFGLDDVNFVRDINVLSASEIFELLEHAKLNFGNKKLEILKMLKQLEFEFVDYVKDTARLLN